MPPNRTEEGRARKKPGKPITSCAECRRLKLRCDKQIPCSTCVTRGCDSICPDGSLVSRKKKGVFVLSSTKDLHERIDTLVSRISSLEGALHTAQPSHPLLAPELLAQKASSDGEDSEKAGAAPEQGSPTRRDHLDIGSTSASDEEKLDLEEAFGTLAIEEEGMTGFLGGTSRVEYLLRAGDSLPTDYQHTSRLKPRVVQAALSMFKPSTKFELISEILSSVPPLSVATQICEGYLANFSFLYQPMSRSELFDGVFQKVYDPTSNSSDDIHIYGLLFSILALGSLFDINQTVPGLLSAHDYHLLSLACISISPLYYPKASLDKVEQLLYIAMYMHFADYGSVPRHDAWATIGFALRLSVSIGLHLNNERWNLPAADLSRRSRVFWTIYMLDMHIGFGLGRPPSLCPTYIDCPIPKGVTPQGVILTEPNAMSYHEWMARFTAVMHNVQLTAFSTVPPSYSDILSLDQQVRNFPTPEHLRMNNLGEVRSEQVAHAMPRVLTLLLREGVLLAMHKRYLYVALREMPQDLLKHRYAPSVMAVYRSSWRLIEALIVFWSCQSRPYIERISGIWSYVMAGCLAMCNLVTKAPSSSLTPVALSMLDRTADLFRNAVSTCQFALQHCDFICELQDNAHSAANAFQNGVYSSSNQLQTDRFDRLAGKTHLIYTPSSKGLAPSTPPEAGHFSLSTSPRGDEFTCASGAAPDNIDSTGYIHSALLQDISLFNSSQVIGVDDLTPDYPEASLAYMPHLSNIPTTQTYEDPSDSWNGEWPVGGPYSNMDWMSQNVRLTF